MKDIVTSHLEAHQAVMTHLGRALYRRSPCRHLGEALGAFSISLKPLESYTEPRQSCRSRSSGLLSVGVMVMVSAGWSANRFCRTCRMVTIHRSNLSRHQSVCHGVAAVIDSFLCLPTKRITNGASTPSAPRPGKPQRPASALLPVSTSRRGSTAVPVGHDMTPIRQPSDSTRRTCPTTPGRRGF